MKKKEEIKEDIVEIKAEKKEILPLTYPFTHAELLIISEKINEIIKFING